MILPALFFYLFAGICVGSAFMVIASRNPVHSVLFLILAFVNASGLFVMTGAEFLAMILIVVYVGAVAVLFLFVVMMLDVNFVELRQGFLQYLPVGMLIGAEFLGVALVLVYVGAVMVLFLFVVMMLDVDIARMREGYVRYLPVGLLVAVAMLAEILALIGVKSRSTVAFAGNDAALAADSASGNTHWLAESLFTRFMLPFEAAAVILTVAVIAAVMLTLRRRPGAKHQDPSWQANVRAADRFRMVRMEATKPPAGGQGGEA
jgi:NADH-quinone oxidoreductase subunit J